MTALSAIEIEERAASSRALLNDPIVQEAFQALENRYLETLIQNTVGDLTAAHAHAMLRAIRELKTEFHSMVTDKTMREKYRKGRS